MSYTWAGRRSMEHKSNNAEPGRAAGVWGEFPAASLRPHIRKKNVNVWEPAVPFPKPFMKPALGPTEVDRHLDIGVHAFVHGAGHGGIDDLLALRLA